MTNDNRRNQKEVFIEREYQNDLFGNPPTRWERYQIARKHFREKNPKEVFFEPKDSGQIEIVGTTKPEGSTRIGQRDRTFSPNGIMHSLEATSYKQPPQILVIDPYNRTVPLDQKATTTLRTNHSNGNPQIMVMNKGESQHYRLYDEKGLAPTLQSQSGMSSQKHPFIVDTNNKREYNGKHEVPKVSKKVNPQMVSQEQKVGGFEGVSKEDVLRLELPQGSNASSVEKETDLEGGRKLSGKASIQEKGDMRNVRTKKENRNTSYQREQNGQPIGKLERDLSGLPHKITPNKSEKNDVEETQEGQNGAFRVRRLMPLETEALMSWPRDWTRWGIDEKGNKVEISDSQRYKMCGNGIVSNVVKEVITQMIPQ